MQTDILTNKPGEAEAETRSLEEIASIVVDTAFHLYQELGPGLLESVYQSVLASMLERRGLRVERQKLVTFEFDGIVFNDGLRVDLLVEGCLVVELKSLETVLPIHLKQLLTYLRLLKLPLGLLVNFGGASFKGAVKRVVNNRIGFVSEFRVTRSRADNGEVGRFQDNINPLSPGQ
jgi:GxxExxY protein